MSPPISTLSIIGEYYDVSLGDLIKDHRPHAHLLRHRRGLLSHLGAGWAALALQCVPNPGKIRDKWMKTLAIIENFLSNWRSMFTVSYKAIQREA